MYNNELKERFLNTVLNTDASKNKAREFFNRSKGTEEKYNKDLSCFTIDEILDLYRSYNMYSTDALRRMHTDYLKYADFLLVFVMLLWDL